MKKNIIKGIGCSVLPLLMVGCDQSEPSKKEEDKKPLNVLFIAVDDLRPELNCYGADHIKSPNIDRLSNNGIQFNRAYCNVPVSGASRASLLSGVRPSRDRFVNYYTWLEKDMPSAICLPQHFKNNGYYAVSNGKVFHHLEDKLKSWSETPWKPYSHTWRDYQLDTNMWLDTAGGPKRGPAFECAEVPDDAYFDGRIANKTIHDLQRLKKMDKPFFLAVGFLKPHLPFNAPRKYWELYDRDSITLPDNYARPENVPGAAMHNWGELRAYHDIPDQGPLSDSMAITLRHGYYACVSYTDAMIGKVIEELKRLGLYDNTLIVLWGDHGWNLGNHSLWCKHCNFETAMHVPLIMAGPGIRKDIKTNALVELLDIYPSLCDICGLDKPRQLQGKSLMPLFSDPSKEVKERIFSRWYSGLSVKTDSYMFTLWQNDSGEEYARMLFDHTKDYQETVNVSEKENYKQVVIDMMKWIKEGRSLEKKREKIR